MSLSRVPPEIWSEILHYIPQAEQTKLLNVSRCIHDIALDLVFSAVKVYFIGGERAGKMLNSNLDEFVEEMAGKLMTRSWELLRRITKDPSFARVVKSLTVVAFNDSSCMFEKFCLIDALVALPYLRTFRWYGTSPALTDEIVGNIPASIQHLSLQTYVPSHEVMERFTSVKQLSFPSPFLFPDDEEIHDGYAVDEDLLSAIDPPNVRLLLGQMGLASLQSLTLNAECVSAIPIRVLGNLKELTICMTTDCESLGLDLVFHHAIQLESLTVAGFIEQRDFLHFIADASCLPALHSFRLSCDSDIMVNSTKPEFLNVITTFIGERTQLRRLYLRIPNIHITLDTLYQLDVIGKLKHLEVLGFHTGHTQVDGHVLQAICDRLPKALKAFHLGMDWCGPTLLPFVDILAAFPNLTFAHFYSVFGRLPILLVDIATEVPTLQTVGLNRALWTVDRNGPELELKKWPRWKIKFCGEEEFVSKDDFWLFQYN